MVQRTSYNDFSGGINNNTPENQIQDNQLSDALNVVFDKRSNLQTRPGLSRVNWNKNLLQRTEELDHTYWNKLNTPVITANTEIAPDSTVTADSIQDDNPVSQEAIYNSPLPVADNQIYTLSIYIKKTTGSTSFPVIQIIFFGGTLRFSGIIIDTNNGVLYDRVGHSPTNKNITDEGDYWRASLTFQNDSSGNNLVRAEISPAFASTLDGNIDNTATGTTIFWGVQLERGLLSKYHKNSSYAPTIADNYLFNKPTSIFDFKQSDGSKAVIVTAGDQIYRLHSNDYLEKITGSLTLPTDTYWQWVVYDDLCIGVNQGTGSNDNPIKIADTTSNGVALGGTPPKAKYIEVWKDRIWLVNGNTLTGSALGDAEDYTTTGAAGYQSFDIGGAEGDLVTAIKSFRDRLFIFKTNHIYYIEPGTPDTDITAYSIKEFSHSLGCISAYGIQPLLQDLIFPSRNGLTSIDTVNRFGDFAETVISGNIKDFKDIIVDETNSASAILPSESQYFIAMPFGGGSTHSGLWCMDYTNLNNGSVGFTRFNGKIIGSTLGNVEYNGQIRVYVGSYTQTDDEDICYIYRYGDTDVYDDDGKLYSVLIKTKSHNMGGGVNNSLFVRVFFILELVTSPVTVGLSYKYNESSARIKSWTSSLTGDIYVGAEWGTAIWGTSLWASPDTLERLIKRKVIGNPGRIARSIQLSISNVNISEAFRFKQYGFDYEPVTSKKD